jgi:hypothetical protein
MSALRSWGASVLAVLGTAVLIAASASAATGSPGAVRLPEFERVTLDNGAELVLMPKRDTPMIAMNVVAARRLARRCPGSRRHGCAAGGADAEGRRRP